MKYRIRELLFYGYFFLHPINKMKELFYLKKCYLNNHEVFGNFTKDKKDNYSSLKKLVLKSNDSLPFFESYFNDELVLKKVSPIDFKNIILICLVKNDLERIKEFYNHYMKIGVKNFVFIDNDSTDGTYEFLCDQSNVSVFQISEQYSTVRRQAWISKIMSYYGYNHWFLIVDSDEFLVYNDCEHKNIDDLIKKFESLNILRARSLMIDMYSDEELFSEMTSHNQSFRQKYCYFDSDTYSFKKHKRFELITGGMRKRIFGSYEDIDPFLIKYPILFYQKGDIQYNSHFSFPFYKNFNTKLYLALLHYKFLPQDLEKVKKRVLDKNYALGSKEYVAYLKAYQDNNHLKLITSNSKQFKNSNDLQNIHFLDMIDWKK